MEQKNISIVVLDDNKAVTQAIKISLERKGFKCIEYNDPEAFLSDVDNIKFDFLMLDLMMPRISGEDVLKDLNSRNLLKKFKIIIYSATMFPREIAKLYPDIDIKAIRKPSKMSRIIDMITKMSENSEMHA